MSRVIIQPRAQADMDEKYYEIEADVVFIRRVLHGARDLSQFFGPQD
jgi:hypothetical protein